METVGFDGGNNTIKIVTDRGIIVYPSDLIAYRKIKVSNELREYDFVYQFGDRKGIAGQLAKDERTAIDKTRRGDTKAHEDFLIRVLIGLHQFTSGHVRLVVGQPISKHSDDKQKIIDMLKGTHLITVNGRTKEITIYDVLVGVEGGSASLANPQKSKVHLIDIGSGTINFATVQGGQFLNAFSDTIPKGLENLDTNYEAIAANIRNFALDLEWKDHEPTYLLGGGANVMMHYLEEYEVFEPFYNGELYNPTVANAIGFKRLGDMVWRSQ